MAERVYVAIDLETTGLDPNRDTIIEIGAVCFQAERVLDRFVSFVNPQRKIPLRIQQITGIRNSDVANAPTLAQIAPELLAFVNSNVAAVVAHNAGFDLGFLRAAGIHFHRPALDTFELATILLPNLASYNLGELCRVLAVPLTDAHRALGDAEATAQLFMILETLVGALPAATVQLIVNSGQHVEWAPLMLFEAAARRGERELARADTWQTRLSGENRQGVQRPRDATNEQPPAGLLTNSSAAWRSVPDPVVAEMFAADGPLAAQMGAMYEMRAGQVQMAQHVLHALNTGDYLLVEAGTGTGKSLAYLLPAALWSVANGRRAVIATNTIALQDQLIQKDIPQLQAVLTTAGYAQPNVALLKGRTNYLCPRRLDVWRNNHRLSAAELSLLAKVLVWLPQTTTGDVGELFLPTAADRAIWARLCSDAATCTEERCGKQDFFWRARRQAESAHLLIVNHALLLADLAAGRRILPPYNHLIVDEAHRLEEAATEQLTYRVDWQNTQALLRRLTVDYDLLPAVLHAAAGRQQPGVPGLIQELSGKASRAGKLVRDFAEKLLHFAQGQTEMRKEAGYPQRLGLDSRVRVQPLWSELEIEWDSTGRLLRNALTHATTLARLLEEAQWWQAEPFATLLAEVQGAREQLAELVDQINTIVQQPSGTQAGLVTWLELNDAGNAVALASAPLDVNEILEKELLQEQRSAIFTGATLRTGSGFSFIRDRLGLWDVPAVTVESPFDYKSSTLLYLPDPLPAPTHPHYQQAVEQAIIEAAQATGGRTLALFTSYAQLRATADAIRAPLDRLGITVLQHGTSSRNRLLREYREAEKAVLLGTRSFWEGIDLPGDELSCLLIVRLPFAVPSDPLVAARAADLEDPFTDYTLPDAILRFRQGFGRLIRRATDRGVIVVLDNRLWQKEYGRAFLDSLPTCTVRRAPLSNLGEEIEQWLGR